MTNGIKCVMGSDEVMINEMEILEQALGETEPVHDRFVIDNMDKLDWAIRKSKKIKADCEAKVECAQRQIVRLEAFIKAVREEADKNLDGLSAMMRPYVQNLLEGAKTKTFKAPSGKVSLRKQPPEIEKDDEKLVAFIKGLKRDDLIQTVEKPKWGEMKKELTLVERADGTGNYVTSDGEVVPVKVRLRDDKLVVE